MGTTDVERTADGANVVVAGVENPMRGAVVMAGG
eukprot:CAMPEP_0194501444 /NCGR_PEP_ID=MMETSP0253-20130528/22683_1 /TAXON_ID=2966 /ORGANISM="Noctiluca scintillans" /LENGTH=33 /DNA_ID= /DNA_START= /DNA_END= /DNA_ORIENTATION=